MEKEVPEFLYHYTSINTLGLILKNKTIRFNNLTAMDDLDEADFGGKNWGKYCFISSWTDEFKESIPMWNMYSNNMGGVRIKMPTYPFAEHEEKSTDYIQIEPGIRFVIPLKDICNSQYGTSSYIQKGILCKVKYNDMEYQKNMKNKNLLLKKDGTVNFQGNKLGIYKNEYWKFQNEWRYRILFYPIGVKNQYDAPWLYNQQIKNLENVPDLPFSDYYLSLREDAIQQMEIMLGPKTNEIDYEIVQMLVDKYCPEAKIVKGELTGKIK